MATADRYFALGVESTYGTSVTPTLFLPVASANIEEPPPAMIDFGGIRYGEYGMNEQDIAFGPRVGGSVSFEGAMLQADGYHTLLSHVFGSISTTSTTPTRVSALTIASTNGKFMTAQVVKPYHDGTASLVQTAKGSKFTQASLSLVKGGVVRLSGTMDVRNVVSNVATTTASYSTASRPFLWHKTSTLTVDGSTVTCSGWTVNITRPLETNTDSLSSDGLKTEPPNNGNVEIELTLNDVLFDGVTHYNNVMSTSSSDRIKAVVIKTTSDTNTGQYIQFSAGKAMYMSGPPDGLTRDQYRIPMNLTFRLLYATTGTTPLTCTLVHV